MHQVAKLGTIRATKMIVGDEARLTRVNNFISPNSHLFPFDALPPTSLREHNTHGVSGFTPLQLYPQLHFLLPLAPNRRAAQVTRLRRAALTTKSITGYRNIKLGDERRV